MLEGGTVLSVTERHSGDTGAWAAPSIVTLPRARHSPVVLTTGW